MADREEIDLVVKGKAEGLDKIDGALQKNQFSFTELNSAFSLVKQGLQIMQTVFDATIGKYADYAIETGNLASNIGLTSEETSRAIQGLDDLGVKAEAAGSMFEYASKNGFTPSIENLAQLADRTNAIADPTQRSAELAKIFGRNWAEIAPALAKGGDAIINATKAVSDGLIVTQDSIDKARALKIAQDNLNDSWDEFSMSVGPAAIDKLTAILKVLNDLANLDPKKNKNWFQDGAEAAAKFTAVITGIPGKLDELTAGVTEDEHILRMHAQATTKATVEQKKLTQAVTDGGHAFKGTKEEADAMIALLGEAPTELENLTAGLNDTTKAADDLTKATETAEEAEKRFFGSVDTGLDNTIQNYMDKLKFLTAGGGELAKLTEHIAAALVAGKITEPQANEMFGEAFVAVEALKVNIGQITADQAAQNIASTLGISLDEAVAKIALIKGIDGAKLEAYLNLTITENYTPDPKKAKPVPQYASGGRPTPGEPAMIGEEGPEIFVPDTPGTIIPNRQIKNMGPTITNNYNYNIHTTAGASSLLSYGKLKKGRA